MDKLRKGCVLD